MLDNQENRIKFSAIMLGVAENYGQTITATGGDLRFKALQGFELAEIEKAAMSIISTRKYTTMPTIADFLEHLGGGNIEDQAEVEAGKVLEAIVRVGGNKSVVFDDATTQAVVLRGYGGWPKLCEECGAEESEKWFRKEFVKLWAAYKRQGVQQFGVLAGRTEIQNTASGYFKYIQPPCLLGDITKSKAILAAGEEQEMLEQAGVNILHKFLPANTEVRQ